MYPAKKYRSRDTEELAPAQQITTERSKVSSNNNNNKSQLEEKVESLEESNSQKRRYIEFLNDTLESERNELDDLRLKLIKTE